MDNPWIILAAAAGTLVVVAWALGIFWDRVVVPFVLRTPGDLDDRLSHAAKHATQALIVSAGTFLVLGELSTQPRVAEAHVTPYLRGLLLAATVTATAWLCSRLLEELISWYLERLSRGPDVRLDQQIMPLLRRIMRMALLFIALTIVLDAYHIKLTALLGAAGVASLAVAFAAQETLANMIGGLTIMVDRPFRVGDLVEFGDGQTGFVHEIGIRTTKILTFQRSLLIIPNAELVKRSLTNLSYPNPSITVRQKIGVAYDADVDKARRVLLEILAGHPVVLKDPAPEVLFTEFGDSALDLLVIYSVRHHNESFRTTTEVNTAILARFAAEGIEIPFPQRVVHLRGDTSPRTGGA